MGIVLSDEEIRRLQAEPLPPIGNLKTGNVRLQLGLVRTAKEEKRLRRKALRKKLPK